MKRLAATLAVAMGLALLAAAPSAEAQVGPTGRWRTVRVGVLPIHYYGRAPDNLFVERPEVRRARELAGRWQRQLEQELSQRDQLELLRAAQVRERLGRSDAFVRAADLAAERHALGVQRYHDLDTAAAGDDFERARRVYEDALAEFARPEDVADVHFYRGLVAMEQGDPDQARAAFRAMLTVDPARRVTKGYHPETTERAIAGAAADLASATDKIGVVFPKARLDALSAATEIDVWVVGVVDGPPDAPVLSVSAYLTRAGSHVFGEQIPLTDEDRARDHLDRSVSALHTCLLERDEKIRAPARKRWFVDIAYQHGVWLSHEQTRDFLHGPGARIGVTWEPAQALQLYLSFTEQATLSDARADLLSVLLTTHLGVGAGLALGSTDARYFVRAGLDLGVSGSDIEMTTDVDCKFFPRDHPRCGRIFTAEAPAIWLGLEFAFGTRIALSRSWYLTAQVGITTYVLDPEVSNALNFPVRGTLGFGAPF